MHASRSVATADYEGEFAVATPRLFVESNDSSRLESNTHQPAWIDDSLTEEILHAEDFACVGGGINARYFRSRRRRFAATKHRAAVRR